MSNTTWSFSMSQYFLVILQNVLELPSTLALLTKAEGSLQQEALSKAGFRTTHPPTHSPQETEQ